MTNTANNDRPSETPKPKYEDTRCPYCQTQFRSCDPEFCKLIAKAAAYDEAMKHLQVALEWTEGMDGIEGLDSAREFYGSEIASGRFKP